MSTLPVTFSAADLACLEVVVTRSLGPDAIARRVKYYRITVWLPGRSHGEYLTSAACDPATTCTSPILDAEGDSVDEKAPTIVHASMSAAWAQAHGATAAPTRRATRCNPGNSSPSTSPPDSPQWGNQCRDDTSDPGRRGGRDNPRQIWTQTPPKAGPTAERDHWATRPPVRGGRLVGILKRRYQAPVAHRAACRDAEPDHDPNGCVCLMCHGFYAATTDPDSIAAMLRGVSGGLLAIRTAAVSRLPVVDINTTHGGTVDQALMTADGVDLASADEHSCAGLWVAKP